MINLGQLENLITLSIIGGIIIAVIILYIIWLFIRSAVESGTVRAIEKILHDYTDLIEDVYPDDTNNN